MKPYFNDDFSKMLVERVADSMTEASKKCNHTGAGVCCPVHGDADCNSSKQNRAESFMPDELVGTTYEVVMEDGEVIIIEKMDGKDDNGFKSCWKGYRKAGTKMKGGKEVNNCVKAGYEMDGEQELDEKNGLYANIHAKRRRGEAPAKPGHEDYPAKDAFKKAAKTAKKEEVEYVDEKRDMPGNQEKIDANKNGKVDAHDFAILRARKGKKTVKEMWQLAAEAKAQINIMPEIDDKDPGNVKKKEKKAKESC